MRTLFVIAMLSLFVGASYADFSAVGELPAGTYPAGFDRDDVLWCQAPDDAGSGLASQIALDYPFEATVADDYITETDITMVEWWGVHWNYSELVDPDSFMIRVWSDDFCLPGVIEFEADVADYGVEGPATDRQRFWADITIPFAGDPHKWLSVQAVMFFTPYGQWGWSTSLDFNECDAVQMFPELGMYEFAPHDYIANAFCLYGGEVPTQESTWGAVKSLFK